MTFLVNVNDGIRPSLSRFRFAAAANVWAEEIAPVVERAIRGRAPVGQGPGAGRLQKSVRHAITRSSSGVTITFTAPTPYTGYVVRGTRAHEIRPRNASALHWVTEDGDRFARLVHHPGTRPNPFAVRAVTPLIPIIRERFKAAVSDALKKA